MCNIDKLMMTDKNNITVIFTDKTAFNIYCGEGKVLQLASYLLGIDLVPEVTEVDSCMILKAV
jgi:hypothetical protein